MFSVQNNTVNSDQIQESGQLPFTGTYAIKDCKKQTEKGTEDIPNYNQINLKLP